MKIFHGKAIDCCSFVPCEKEILLSPNMQFKVRNALHEEIDGFFYLDLEEKQKKFVF